MKTPTPKKQDPLKTAWLRAPKNHEVIVTVSRLAGSEDFLIVSWARKGRSLRPRIHAWMKSSGRGVERALGDQVRRFLETEEFERANPGVLPTEAKVRAWQLAKTAKPGKKPAKARKA